MRGPWQAGDVVVQFRPEHIGRRVTIRSLTGEIGLTGRPQATDAIGRLVAVQDDRLTVERRDGSHVEIDRAQVVAARLLPDRPLRPRRAVDVSADDLTRIASRCWPAVVTQPLGDWELRASGGFTRRANSVGVHGDPGMPFAEARDAIIAFADRHGIPPLAQVPTDSAWHRTFLEAGWEVDDADGTTGALVHVVNLGDAIANDSAPVTSTASDDWLLRYGRIGDASLARAVLEGPERVGFAAVDQAAVGRVAIAGEWAGLGPIAVDAEHRREGSGRRLVAALLDWAIAQHADKAYAEVEPENDAALALCRRFGFIVHHRYAYLRPGDGG